MDSKKVGILTAGSWGTAVGEALARAGHRVELWTREKETVRDINEKHENKKRLPKVPLSHRVSATANMEKCVEGKDFVFFATPSLYIMDVAKRVACMAFLKSAELQIGILTKGFVLVDGKPLLIVDALEQILPDRYKSNLVYISGPSHAEEVGAGKLTGLIAASANPKNSILFRELLKSKTILAFSSFDIAGVQVCGAAKNVMAIMFGCLDALSQTSPFFGDNAQSLLLAASLNEIQTLGAALGATHAETFTSIAGVGDLDVTCRSKYGRNRQFGLDIIQKSILSRFSSIDDLVLRIDEIGYLPEGAAACRLIHQIAQEKSLKLPICEGLYKILNKEMSVQDFIDEIMK